MEPNSIIAIATVAIAFFGLASLVLAWIINQKDKENRQQTSDLFQAIVISNFLSHPEIDEGQAPLDRRVQMFKKYNKGTTPIHLISIDERKV